MQRTEKVALTNNKSRHKTMTTNCTEARLLAIKIGAVMTYALHC